MAYGLQVFNSNNEFLLTDTYVKPWFMAKGTVSSVIGPYQIDFQESIDGGSTYTQKNFRAYTVNYTIPNHNAITKTGYAAITLPNTNIFYSTQVYWQSGSGFSIDLLVPTTITATASDTPEVYLFCIENINAYSTSGYGLQIFNNVPQCMYDSNYQAFRPLYAINSYTPFPYFGGGSFIGSNPKIGSIITGGVNVYDFSSFSSITKPIYVLPPFTYYIQVKDQTDPIYTITSGDPYWQYTFKTFYSRDSNNRITSKAYFNQSFYESEASSGQTWTSYGNAQNYVILSDGGRYSTSGGGTFANATYSLSITPTSPLEGTNFTITLTTTNVPNGSIFNWTLTGDTLTSTDFSGNYSSGTMTVQSNNSSVTFTPLIDAVNDTEQYVFELFDSNGLVIRSLTFTVSNTATPAATYSLSRTPATGNINEGDSFTISVATTYVQPGTVLNYTVGSNFDSLDGNNLHVAGTFPALSGTFQSASTSKTFVTNADTRTDGFKTFTLTLSHGFNPSISIGVNDSSQSIANGAMLDLSTTTPSRDEGQSASVIGNWDFGSYIYDGRSFKLQIASSSVANSSDVTISPSGFVTLTDIYSSGELIAQRRVWTVSITEDQTTESATESLILEVVDNLGYTYDTQTITISDTSKSSTVSASLSASPTNITSGNSSTLTWSTTNATSASISGVGNVSPVSSGSISVSPTSTTTYTLTASNGQNSAQANATVTVTAGTYYTPSVILTPSRSGYTTQQCNGVASNIKLINAPPNTVVNFSGTTSGTITTNSSGEFDFGSYTFSNFTGNWTFVFSNSGNGLVNGGQTQNYSVSWVDCTVGLAWYNIVSVTGSNGNQSPVSPVNQYYRRQIIAFTYSAAEITAATGKSSGTIQQLRFYVSGVPNYQPYPNWAIGLKNHSNGISNDPGNTGYAIVWGPESTNFYSGYNTFDIANFNWSGNNLGITFAWGQVPTNYSSSGQNYINNTGLTYHNLTDGAGTYTINSDGYSGNTSGRPAIEIYI